MKSGQEVLDDRGYRNEIHNNAEAPAAPAVIIAYGNPLRNDDGLAWSVADALERKLGPASVEIVRLQQLTPELAEKVSRFQTVIFIDAEWPDRRDRQPGDVHLEEIAAQDFGFTAHTRFSHFLTPSVLVNLAAKLYGANARAFSVTVTGQNFDHGQSISPAVQSALPRIASRIEQLLATVKAETMTEVGA